MTSGEHSNGVAPVRELNLGWWGIKQRWHDWEREKEQSCWVKQEAQWDGGDVRGLKGIREYVQQKKLKQTYNWFFIV